MDWELLRCIIAITFISVGMVLFIIEIYGVFRFSFVLNRMHAAAIGDTLALSCCLIGLIIKSGFSFVSAKFLLVIAFLWVSSPAASHLISKFEVTTNENADKHFERQVLEKEE